MTAFIEARRKMIFSGGAMPDKKYIECGKILNTHGVEGALKLESRCNMPEDLAGLERVFIPGEGGALMEYKVEKSSVMGHFVLVWLEGVKDIEAAGLFKNKNVFAARKDFSLEDGEFFIADIIGLDVIDKQNGTVYGKLSEIINRGSSDIYVVNTAAGDKMIPAVPEFIAEVDLKKGIFVTPIPGMFDE